MGSHEELVIERDIINALEKLRIVQLRKLRRIDDMIRARTARALRVSIEATTDRGLELALEITQEQSEY